MREGASERDGAAGGTESLWMATTPETDYEALDDGLTVDVAVVGGGIVGLTAATHLLEADRTVAVVEAGRIVEGVTGRTTAKVTSQHGVVYERLRKRFDTGVARRYAEANQAAVEEVAERAAGIDCDFERRPAYVYGPGEEKLEREARAARAVGLPASYVEEVPLSFADGGAVRFDDQGQFHPRKYLLALAERIPGDGGHLFEETRARDVDDGAPCRVRTDRGTITAESVVVATHFPLKDPALYFARAYPKRSYVLALRTAGSPPEGMFYRDDSDSYVSVRTHPTDDGELVLFGGQSHKTGQGGSERERYRRLERAARSRFDVEEVTHRWSTQDYASVDHVPFVGRIGPGYRNVYAATGFGGWGMSNGTAAGRILSDLVRGRENEWAEAFDPTRLTPRASAKSFLEENANAGGRFVGDWATEPRARSVDDVEPGEGRVIRRGSDVLAVSRDEEGELSAVSAVCTHLRCLVDWNDAEGTWDCPCHGSRFEPDGDVIDGPANRELPDREL